MSASYEVGQRLWVLSNRGTRQQVTVAKVGRKLVTVAYDNQWQTETFRMDTGRINDNYGRSAIYTQAELEERDARADLSRRLREVGVEFRLGFNYTADALEQVFAILQRDKGASA